MKTVTLIRRSEGIARLCFERSDKSVNVLDECCVAELEQCMVDLEADPPQLLILESMMPGCFIAGADLDLIAGMRQAEAATDLATRGQSLCRRIEVLPAISIALVHGVCMGGGLEVALACDYIVALESTKTLLALPEIKIGIHPGFGGCVRLPKRVGWMKAVEMILSGQSLDAKRAKRVGLADICCHPKQADAAVTYLRAKGKVGSRAFQPWWLKVWPARWLFFQQVEKTTYRRFKGIDVQQAYPAVPATIALLKEIIGMPDREALRLEAQSLGRLAVTASCKNLIHVFHLGESLKKQDAALRGRDAVSLCQKTAVYGAGVMGSGIAWVAAKTMAVDLHDVAPEALSRGMQALHRLATRHGNSKGSRSDQQRLQRIRPVLDGSGLATADVVIEAVLEDMTVKHALWSDVAKSVSHDALLLSNTSSLSISAMQAPCAEDDCIKDECAKGQCANPGRMVGLHFFNPAPKMPLVEVIAGAKTTTESLDKTCALAVSWGKYPIVVADRPGFLINRCLMPFMAAALKLLESGQKPEHVDGALKHFGMPMGAIELMDRVGLDICHHVGQHLTHALAGTPDTSNETDANNAAEAVLPASFALPAWFDRMVDDGLLGEKSAYGFFVYSKGKQGELNPKLANYLPSATSVEHAFDANISASNELSVDAIVDACLIPMLLEALCCLAEHVVDDAQQLDAAFVYGVGFPPFRGGLLRYFASYEQDELKQKITACGRMLPDNLDVLDAFRG